MDPLALVGAAGDVQGQLINAFTTAGNNRAQRKWASSMFDKQYQTNVEFWRMQNEYNSPQAVMQRNQQAGLNPHFGLLGNAPTPAGSIESPDVQPYRPQPLDLGSGISAAANKISQYQMFERQRLENNNLATQNEILNQDLIRKQFDSQIRGIDFANYEDQKKGQLDAIKLKNDQTRAQTQFTWDRNSREAASTASNLNEAVERVLTMQVGRDEARARISNLKKDGEIKQMELELRQLGVKPGSADWIYAVGMFINHLIGN